MGVQSLETRLKPLGMRFLHRVIHMRKSFTKYANTRLLYCGILCSQANSDWLLSYLGSWELLMRS